MHFNRLRCALLLAVMMLSVCAVSTPAAAESVGVLVSVSFGPPALPVYVQPACPRYGYIWMPGYWAWNPYFGYYWVPGTWVLSPRPGLLWTPGYWAFDDGLYYWYPGYWGPAVGFYGGIDYGFGYPGTGYYGGYWRGDSFYYNQTVNNVSVTTVHNVYTQTVVNNTTTLNRASFSGPGGVTARATAEQQVAASKRVAPTAAQMQHEKAASGDTELRASVNQGKPPVAATAQPAQFKGRGVVAAREAGAPYKAPKATEGGATPSGSNTPGASAKPDVARPEKAAPPEREARPERAAPPERGARPERAAPPEREARPEPRRGNEPPPARQAPPDRQVRPDEARPDRRAPRDIPERIEPPRRDNAAPPPREARPEPEPHRGMQPPPTRQAPPERKVPPDKQASPDEERKGPPQE